MHLPVVDTAVLVTSDGSDQLSDHLAWCPCQAFGRCLLCLHRPDGEASSGYECSVDPVAILLMPIILSMAILCVRLVVY